MLIVEFWMYREGNINIWLVIDNLISNHAFWKKKTINEKYNQYHSFGKRVWFFHNFWNYENWKLWKFFLGKKPPKILISYKVAFYSDMAAAYRMINRFMMSLKSGTTNWQKKVYFYLLFDLHFSVSCSA